MAFPGGFRLGSLVGTRRAGHEHLEFDGVPCRGLARGHARRRRDRRCSVDLFDPCLSACLHEHRGTVFVVRDVGSLNGTYVQRERIDEKQLRSGDEVQIGKYRLVFYPSPLDAAGR